MSRLTALSGLRVVELGAGIAGAFAARLLGDHGADVVKLTTPAAHVTDTSDTLDPTDARSPLFAYLNWNKRLIALRRDCPPLVTGNYLPISAQGDLLIYRREAGDKALIVVLNLGADPIAVTSSAIRLGSEILLSTFLDREGERLEGVLDLRGNEGVIVVPSS